MRSNAALLIVFLLSCYHHSISQVDTSYIYNPTMSYGVLDIRIAKTIDQYYYLEEDKTFSFREINGARTNSYLDMTAWDSDLYRQGNMKERSKTADHFIMNYRLLVPENYKPDYTEGYPLVILMHGSLERGNCSGSNCYHATSSYSPNANMPPAPKAADHELLNNDYNLVHGGSNYLEAHKLAASKLPSDPALNARSFPGFVLFPQNLNGWDKAAVEDAIRLVRLISKKYNINKNKIYINGVSNGGRGAYEAMKRAPWLFAASILFSAADDAAVVQQDMSKQIAGIPMWIFQGGKDTHPSPKKTENYVKTYRNAGANVRYTLYSELAHGTWNKAFSEPDFFNWLLRQGKNNIHVFSGNAAICKTTGEGAVLRLPEGYASYEWEHNGQVLSSANSAQHIATVQGAYRGRYSILQIDGSQSWNEWSNVVNVTETNPSAAQVKQIGTALLKDPNRDNVAVLEAEGNYAHYYWYKKGSLLNLAGDQDDSTKVVSLKLAQGNGEYYLQVAGYDNCKSPPSTSKHIFFSDSAPINVTAPTRLSAKNISPSEVSLTWQDASDNERGFEIWRRIKINQEYSAWHMTALTSENITSFRDKNLLPSSTYHFMMRAVSNFGRSEYSGQPVITTTLPDNEPPSIPIELTASQVAVKTVRLTWNPSADNSAVREYFIYFNNDTLATSSNDTTFLVREIDVNMNYTFTVKAVDLGNNLSDASNEAKIYTSVNGLFYQHSTGAWDGLEGIDWSIAEFTGNVSDFTMTPKTQEDFFNFRFDGYLHIENEGVYQFRVSSDDGSRLSLDDSVLVENDGVHNFTSVTSPIQIFSAGPHRITADFFDYVKSDSLLVEYKGPDSNNDWTKIPSEVLRSTLITSTKPDNEETTLSIYPNPTTADNINIQMSSSSQDPAYMSITSNTGSHLYDQTVSSAVLKNGFKLSELGRLQTGFYIIEIRQGKAIIRKKIIIKQ